MAQSISKKQALRRFPFWHWGAAGSCPNHCTLGWKMQISLLGNDICSFGLCLWSCIKCLDKALHYLSWGFEPGLGSIKEHTIRVKKWVCTGSLHKWRLSDMFIFRDSEGGMGIHPTLDLHVLNCHTAKQLLECFHLCGRMPRNQPLPRKSLFHLWRTLFLLSGIT